MRGTRYEAGNKAYVKCNSNRGWSQSQLFYCSFDAVPSHSHLNGIWDSIACNASNGILRKSNMFYHLGLSLSLFVKSIQKVLLNIEAEFASFE